jgi:hypothetical protein
MWRRVRRRAIYTFLRTLRWLARRRPHMRMPGFIPLVGDIDDRIWAPPVTVHGRGFGRSMTIPAILEIKIDGRGKTASPAAFTPVATRLFADYPPFLFNVSFACGSGRMFRPGVYGDPRSPWFNVFVGYYQIDVSRTEWSRPFGYTHDGQLEIADLARLGEADWNYFSNHMYGVPLDAIAPVDDPDAKFTVLDSVEIAKRRWDHVEARGMTVASAYLANRDHRRLDDPHPILSDVWRCVFGEPYHDRSHAQSFFPTSMRARLYASFVEADDNRDLRGPVYRTFIFGGTVNEWWGARTPANAAHNEAFMALQMATIEDLIAREFAHLGFAR